MLAKVLKLSRRDADDPLKTESKKWLLVRKAGPERYLGQAEPAIRPQELLRSFQRGARLHTWCGPNPVAALNCRAK